MKLTIKKILLIFALVILLPFVSACTGEKTEDKNNKDNPSSQKEKEKQDEKNSSSEDNETDENNNNEAKEKDDTDLETGYEEGNLAISFELEDFTDGKLYNLDDYLGENPIVINFFGSWCGPCKTEMPDLNEVYKEYEEKGLKVFAVNVGNGDSDEEVKKLISDYILSYPILKDEKGEIAMIYGIQRIPVNIFIGKDGVIKKHIVGIQTKESYEKLIQELFAEDTEE